MSDRQSGTGRKQRKLWIVLILAIVVILGVVIAVNQSSSKQESSTEKSEENEEASKVTDAAEDAAEEDEEDAEETDEGLAFPYLLEEEQIQVDSLFQYSGINPDAENAECEDVAAIQMKNNSEQYLLYRIFRQENLSLLLKVEIHLMMEKQALHLLRRKHHIHQRQE